METTLIDDETFDELFAPRRPAQPITQTGSRTCVYCRSLYKTALDYAGPPLCDGCRDVPATRQRILRDLASVLTQMDAAIAAFDVVARRSADIWERLEQALAMRADGRATEQQLAARWQARMQDPDQRWPELLKAYEDREVALAPLTAERRRLEDAMEAIRDYPAEPAGRDMFGGRKHEYELPEHAKPTECRSCGAGMVFIKTDAGKALPLSLATVEERDGKKYALAHFSDCPNAKEWSKR